MVSTLPDGNGMRIFMQVTGSSIRYSDVTEGKAPGSVLGE
jgi:3-dehydroquinate dehydratase